MTLKKKLRRDVVGEDEINSLFNELMKEISIEQKELKEKMKLTKHPIIRTELHRVSKFNIRINLTMSAYSNRMRGLTVGYHYLCDDKVHQLESLYRNIRKV